MYTPTRIRIFENMPQDHTVMGAIYLSSIEYLWDVVPAVRSHHERWDGKGYPDGLKGEEIPLFARIIFICDYFDELTHFVTSEWGTGPKTKPEALEMIKVQSGKMFDPKLVEIFVGMMEKKGSSVGSVAPVSLFLPVLQRSADFRVLLSFALCVACTLHLRMCCLVFSRLDSRPKRWSYLPPLQGRNPSFSDRD
jgi:hypothetical protein